MRPFWDENTASHNIVTAMNLQVYASAFRKESNRVGRILGAWYGLPSRISPKLQIPRKIMGGISARLLENKIQSSCRGNVGMSINLRPLSPSQRVSRVFHARLSCIPRRRVAKRCIRHVDSEGLLIGGRQVLKVSRM
jgi:hypothetical protein